MTHRLTNFFHQDRYDRKMCFICYRVAGLKVIVEGEEKPRPACQEHAVQAAREAYKIVPMS